MSGPQFLSEPGLNFFSMTSCGHSKSKKVEPQCGRPFRSSETVCQQHSNRSGDHLRPKCFWFFGLATFCLCMVSHERTWCIKCSFRQHHKGLGVLYTYHIPWTTLCRVSMHSQYKGCLDITVTFGPPPPGWTFLFLTILATCFVFTFTGVLQTQRNGSSNFVGTALPVTPCAVVASWTTTNRRVPHRILCHLTWHFLQRVYRSRKMPYHPFMPPQKQQILGQCFRRAGDIICM